jgi:hypothetical protein
MGHPLMGLGKEKQILRLRCASLRMTNLRLRFSRDDKLEEFAGG